MNLTSFISTLHRSLLAVFLGGALAAQATVTPVIDYGNYTTDTTSGLDWLDIDQTWGVTDAALRVRLAPGGDLHAQGWVWATQAEVETFWNHAGFSSSGNFDSTQYAAIHSLLEKIRGCLVFQVDTNSPTVWYSGNRLQALTVDGFESAGTPYGHGPAMNINTNAQTAYANIDHYQPREIGSAPDWGYWLKRTTVGAPPVCTVTPSVGGNNAGTISPSSPNTGYPRKCANLTYVSTPNPGNVLLDIKVNGVSYGALTNFTLADVDANTTVQAVFGPPQPEIDVQLAGGTPLTDGVSVIDFGRASPNSGTVTRTIVIVNTGVANLTGLAVTKNSTNAADFSMSALGNTTLAPNESTTFDVTFAPKAYGVRSALIRIASSDYNENPFDIGVTGFGLKYTVMAEFQGGVEPKGSQGVGSLVRGNNRRFYGMTTYGGDYSGGTVYQISPSGKFKTLVQFNGANVPGIDLKGQNPQGGLTLGVDGNFYGLTTYGGINQKGTAFMMPPTGTAVTLTELGSIIPGPQNALLTYGNLLQATDGNFYGMTQIGGTNDNGTIFKMTPAGVISVLVHLGPSTGVNPFASLIQGTDGDFYGTLQFGGTYGYGTVFKVTAAGVFTNLVNFRNNPTAAGAYPQCTLVQDDGGIFYGTTSFGGANNAGTVFRMTPAGNLTTLVEFNNQSTPLGKEPMAGLVRGGDGIFYGSTINGGAANHGTLYRISTGGEFVHLLDFGSDVDPKGGYPRAGIIRAPDGHFYGQTAQGGSGGGGVIYRLDVGLATPAPEIGIQLPGGNDLVNRGTVNFGNSFTGITVTNIFTITNSGALPLHLYDFSLEGADTNQFAVTGPGSTTLEVGASTTFSVKFTPTQPSSRNATLVIENDDPDEDPFEIALTGTGVAPAYGRIDVQYPAGTSLTNDFGSVSFGNVSVSGSGVIKTFVIRNVGDAPLTNFNIGAKGVNEAEFTIDGPATNSVAPGQSTTFTVTFKPDDLGSRFASIRVDSSSINTPTFGVNVTGNAIEEPEISVSIGGTNLVDNTGSLPLGSVPVGLQGAANTITIRNVGSATLSGLALSINGEDTTKFLLGPLGATSLAPGASTTFTVTYAPYGIGSHSATIHIASNDADENPFDINVSGIGLPGAEIVVEQPAGTNLIAGAAVVSFGSVKVGTNADRTFSVKNIGTSSLTGLGITIDGTNATDFSVTVNPVATVSGPTGSTAFTVRFAPGSGGSKSAILHLASNDADENPFDITLTGSAYTEGSLFLSTTAPTTLRNNLNGLIGNTILVGPKAVVVTALGFEDAGLDGLALAHTVSIWNMAGALLAQIAIPAGTGSPLVGNYRTVALPSQLTLSANTSYRIGATVNAGADPWTDKNNTGADYFLNADFASGSPANFQNATFTTQNGSPYRWAPATLIYLTEPEISVRQPAATLLVDGANTNDFGSVNLGAPGVVKSFTITNSGSAALTGLSINQDRERRTVLLPSGDFSIGAPGTNNLAPGASTTFTVTFTPQSIGVRTSAIQITSNDSDENPFDIALTGTGTVIPPVLGSGNLVQMTNGVFRFNFTNTYNLGFSILGSTNPALPIANWTYLGTATSLGGGLYQFSDPGAQSYPARFYQLRFDYLINNDK